MKYVSLFLIPALFLGLIACDGDGDGEDASPPATEAPADTATPQTPAVTVEAPAGTPSPAATATTAPAATPTLQPATTDPVSFPASDGTGIVTLVDVRVGEHPEAGGFDRIVFEFEGGRPAGNIEYVSDVAECGSGLPVDAIEGTSMLLVRFDATQAHNDQGEATIPFREIEGPGTTIVQALQVCDFEGVVEWVISVNEDQAYRMSLLDEAPRVVIDVTWP